MLRLFLMRCTLGNKQSTAVGEARIFCFCFPFPVIAGISTIIIRREEKKKKSAFNRTFDQMLKNGRGMFVF